MSEVDYKQTKEHLLAGPDDSQPVPTQPWWRPIVVQAAALALAVVALFSVYLLARPIAILLAAIIIAVAISPIVERLERLMPRKVSVVVVYVGLALIIFGLFFLAGFLVADEVDELIASSPENRQELEELVNRHDPFGEGRLTSLMDNRISGSGGAISNIALTISQQIASTLIEIVIAIFLSLYWLLAAPTLRKYTLSLFSDDQRRHRVESIIEDVGQKMGGYVRAITIDGIILAVVTFIGLTLMGIPFALVLAIVSGLSVLVPILGPVVAAIPAVLIAFVISPWLALAVLVFYVVVQQIESNILLPNIMHREANIHPLLAVFAVFAGGSIGGILGALIAVPLAGGIQVLVTHILLPEAHRHGGNPVRLPTTDD